MKVIYEPSQITLIQSNLSFIIYSVSFFFLFSALGYFLLLKKIPSTGEIAFYLAFLFFVFAILLFYRSLQHTITISKSMGIINSHQRFIYKTETKIYKIKEIDKISLKKRMVNDRT